MTQQYVPRCTKPMLYANPHDLHTPSLHYAMDPWRERSHIRRTRRFAWLLAVRFCHTSAREPCGCISPDMSSCWDFMSAHILSKLEAEMRWHLRSTCQVIGAYPEQISLLRDVPVVEPVYFAISLPYSPSTIQPRMRSG